MMELVFLPLSILVFKWRTCSKYDWVFTLYYLTYSLILVVAKEIALNSRVGLFYLGVPAFSYVAFMLPELQNAMSENVVKVWSALGLSVAIIALLIIF